MIDTMLRFAFDGLRVLDRALAMEALMNAREGSAETARLLEMRRAASTALSGEIGRVDQRPA
jgi:hypothetical protein